MTVAYGGGSVIIYKPGEPCLEIPLQFGKIHCSMESEMLSLLRAVEELAQILLSAAFGDAYFFTDSLSWLMAVDGGAHSFRVDEFWRALSKVPSTCRVHLSFVRGHSGVVGNERADVVANAAAHDSENRDIFPISLNAAKNRLKRTFCQIDSGGISGNLAATIGPPPKCAKVIAARLDSLDRYDRVVINQLRAGKSPLTHDFLFLMEKIKDSLCPECKLTNDSVAHLLLRCPEYAGARLKWLGEDPSLTMLELYPEKVISYLKNIKRDNVVIPNEKRVIQ